MSSGGTVSHKVALLSRGRSIRRNWSDDMTEDYLDVIAVNWASHQFRYDWLVARDAIVWEHPAFRMPRKGAAFYGGLPEFFQGKVPFARIDSRLTLNGEACPYTFPYALRWVLERWPLCSVDVFGADMEGAGISPISSIYADDRWNRELRYVGAILAKHGERVSFIGNSRFSEVCA